MTALIEETYSWSPTKREDFAYVWTVNEVPISEENWIESEVSQKETGRFLEAVGCDSAWWRNLAEIELVVDIVQKENDDWNGLDLKLLDWATLWGDDVKVLFVWGLGDSQFKKVVNRFYG